MLRTRKINSSGFCRWFYPDNNSTRGLPGERTSGGLRRSGKKNGAPGKTGKQFMKNIAIIDYDAGNLGSVQKALEYLGQKVVVTKEPGEILGADGVVLPGVGAFGDAMEKLRRSRLDEVIRQAAGSGKPFLGICLGLQLLFESSEESAGVQGLSVLRGKILRIPETAGLKIPHIGWNSLEVTPGTRLFRGLPENPFVYFVHSYYLRAENTADVAAVAEYGTPIHAAVERGNLFACQFHPEKSGETGLAILNNFIGLL